MSFLTKNITDILIESSKFEEFNTNPISESMEYDLMKEVNYLTESEFDIMYTEEMIPVLVQESSFGKMYIVELDMLNKLVESYNIDAKEALNRLCEYNEINVADTYVMIESSEVVEEKVKLFSRGSDFKSKETIKKATKSIQDLKDKGIKLITKKSKKKTRK